MKYKHNIFLDDIKSSKISIKGNRLNLKWFDSCVIVFSDLDKDKQFLLELLNKLDIELSKERIRKR